MNNLLSYIQNYSEVIFATVAILMLFTIFFYALITVMILRTMKRTIALDSYYKIYSDYQKVYSYLVENDLIKEKYKEKAAKDEFEALFYFELAYTLIAKIWSLRKNRIIHKEEWELWLNWLKKLLKNELFIKVHRGKVDTYPAYRNLVDKLLRETKALKG